MSLYTFKDDLNQFFFRMPRILIFNKTWARLSKAAQAVYPVIGVHCNEENGEARVSNLTIAILSGLDPESVTSAISSILENVYDFKQRRYTTRRGHRSYAYTIKSAAKKYEFKPGEAILFHKQIVIGGNWLHLIPSAKALYPVMRHFAFCDWYDAKQDEDVFGLDEKLEFAERDYDKCDADYDVLAEYAGISTRSVEPALSSLQRHFLIDKDMICDGRQVWRVHLKPWRVYKREYLNRLTATRYGKHSEKIRN